MPTVFGMMRIKNETMWIRKVLASMLPLCERIFILDDHSTDATDEVCRDFSERVSVYRSPFQGLDESRDKNFLLQRIQSFISEDYLNGDEKSPYWVLALDGDEELEKEGPDKILEAINNTDKHCFSLQVMYLWDSPYRMRVDGVYGHFNRPSLFRLMNKNFTFLSTPWGNGANFHCASVPQELLHGFGPSPARIWHYGYISCDYRKKKYDWYNQIDPLNLNEDCYRHITQGDKGGVSASEKLKHAGPLEFAPVPIGDCA